MSLQLLPRWVCLMLAVLSATIPRSVDSSHEGSGVEDCDGSFGSSNCSNETGYENCADPSICGKGATQGNLPLAFGLTIGAGLSTTIGALLPCIPFVKRSNKLFLSASLATAAGVMLYVSFTEIFSKAQDYLCCATSKHYYLLATLSLFLGIILTIVLDILLRLLKRVQCTAAKRRCMNIRGRFGTYSISSGLRGCSRPSSDLPLHTTNPMGSRTVVTGNHSKSAAADNTADVIPVYVCNGLTPCNFPGQQNGNLSDISNTVAMTTNNNRDDLSDPTSLPEDVGFQGSVTSQNERVHHSKVGRIGRALGFGVRCNESKDQQQFFFI